MNRQLLFKRMMAVALFGVLFMASLAFGYDHDNNPPGLVGGPGTNWENPPGPRGGPGTSPDHWWHHHHHAYRHHYDHDGNPPGPLGGPGTNWENPPGPRGGFGTSPDR